MSDDSRSSSKPGEPDPKPGASGNGSGDLHVNSRASTVPDEELQALLTLTQVPGIGPRMARTFLDHFGSASVAVRGGTSRWRAVSGVGPKLIEKLQEAIREQKSAAELRRCQEHGVQLIGYQDPRFPPALREVPDAPLLLFQKGEILPQDRRAVAIVGSRHCSPYGIRIARQLAASLARAGVTVVSGLARGIDGGAHQAALQAGGRTLAVLANGLGQIYPPEHADLAKQVCQAGAILTESPMMMEPFPNLFPQRNRIISGLSLGVVVVEATPRSGSLSTARHALEQNREVFAVPGPVDSLSSRGCHALIRDGAKLVETVDDILEELGPLPDLSAHQDKATNSGMQHSVNASESAGPLFDGLRNDEDHPRATSRSSATQSGARAPVTLEPDEAKIHDLLNDHGTHVDEITMRTGLPASRVMTLLSMLEVRRVVRRMPGQMYVRYYRES